MARPTPLHWLMLGYLVMVWGLAFYLIAVALEALLPVTVVWARLGLGALVMAAVLLATGKRLPKARIWWGRMLVLSLTGNVMPFFLISWAELSVTSGEVGMLMALMPITTLLLAHRLLEYERLTPLRLAGVAIGFGGVALLLGEDVLLGVAGDRLPGQLATMLATLCYAANGIYAKRLPRFDAVEIACGSLMLGCLLLTGPVVVLQPRLELSESGDALLALLVLGVLATGFATWVYFRVVSDCGPGFLSTINYLIPAVATLAGALLLDEQFGWVQGAALVLVVVGVWLIQPRAIRRG